MDWRTSLERYDDLFEEIDRYCYLATQVSCRFAHGYRIERSLRKQALLREDVNRRELQHLRQQACTRVDKRSKRKASQVLDKLHRFRDFLPPVIRRKRSSHVITQDNIRF